jgi:hypothetical protein
MKTLHQGVKACHGCPLVDAPLATSPLATSSRVASSRVGLIQG